MDSKNIFPKTSKRIYLAEVKTDKILGQKKAGTYMLFCVDEKGKAKKIQRARGIDKEGILYLGHSVNLRSRLMLLYNSSNGKCSCRGSTVHPAMQLYNKYDGYKIKYLRDKLKIAFVFSEGKEEASEYEAKKLKEYRTSFLDSPPLNKIEAVDKKHRCEDRKEKHKRK